MSGEDPRYARGDDARGAHRQGGGGWRRQDGEVVPYDTNAMQSGGEPTRHAEVIASRYDAGRDDARPYDRPNGRPPKGRGHRVIVILLLALLLAAILAVVVLLLNRSKAAPAAAKSTTTPSASASSPRPSPPSTSSSPAASPGTTAGTSPGASLSPGTSSSTIAAGGGGAGAVVANLSALTPLNQTEISSVSDGPEQIGATTYQNSVGFTCDTSGNQANMVYDVANYKFLTTVIGIPSNAANAAGNTMTITFLKDGSTQIGDPITVSLDHPQSVHLDLQGASQLEMTCNAINVNSHQEVYMDAALGNATIGPS